VSFNDRKWIYVRFRASVHPIFQILGSPLQPFNRRTQFDGRVQVGVSSNWGGAITYIGYLSSPALTSLTTDCPTPVGRSSSVYTKSQPLHWNQNLGRSNLIVEQLVGFDSTFNNAIRMDATFTNNESFTINDSHETPEASIRSMFPIPVMYAGSSPFTHDPAVTEKWDDNLIFDSTEPWIGYFKNDIGGYESGLAIYVPSWSINSFWQFHPHPGQPANGMQRWATFAIAPGALRSKTYHIVLGDLNEIRTTVYALEGR
jgi:hypothetical protein